jgi:uncharacterized glyoxalase superfamily protein PhnB
MAQSIFPALRYRDARAAIDWLAKAFGFEATLVVDSPGESVAHAELKLGDDWVMLGSESDGSDERLPHKAGGSSVYVVVADPDGHHERAKSVGAEIVFEPYDTDYGSREYTARDPEGNFWSFGTYRPS